MYFEIGEKPGDEEERKNDRIFSQNAPTGKRSAETCGYFCSTLCQLECYREMHRNDEK